MATLFIGMPVFNGEKYIGRAIESLIHQTYPDWTLLISDNDSKDATASMCDSYCRRDERIHYIKQNKNIGAMNNFKFLLQSADAPFFMWTAADDEWDERFVEACINGMNNKNIDWAFTNIVNIDTFGHIIREYKSFINFAAGNPYLSIANYVLSPEVFGKANLIYGIYRLSQLKKPMIKLLSRPSPESFGYDMTFNLGILCRGRLYIVERVLFRKRHARITDTEDRIDKLKSDNPYVLGKINDEDFQVYKNAMIDVSKGTEFEELVQSLMDYRQELQKNINLLIEEATWKFAKWTWLKRLLKSINYLRKQYFKKSNVE